MRTKRGDGGVWYDVSVCFLYSMIIYEQSWNIGLTIRRCVDQGRASGAIVIFCFVYIEKRHSCKTEAFALCKTDSS